MKKFIILFLISHLSLITKAQSGTMLPNGFILPNLAADPSACTVADKGKMYYNTTTNILMFCNGTNWKQASELWSKNQANNDINYSGNVGINTTTPQYDLDVNGTGRFGTVLTTNIGVGSSTNPSGLEVVDGNIAITSSVDSKTYRYNYSDVNNALTLQENGVTRMMVSNGGNVGIGAVVPTAKLSVDGSGSFSGDLTVNNGKGLIRSTTSSSYKYFTATVTTSASFVITAGGCSTSNSSLTSGGFSTAPLVSVGNLLSGTGDFGKLVINVQSATSTQAVIRFCNPTGSNITLSSIVFNLLCIGQ